MTKKTAFIILGVFLLAIFLSACHPRRWGPGCEINQFGPEEIRSYAAADMISFNGESVNRI